MTKPINTESIEKATNKSWDKWVQDLDAAGGQAMSHTELAEWLKNELSDKIESHAWWAQSITVAYEQHIGKRIPGQLADGTFEIAVSKSLSIDRGVAFSKISSLLSGYDKFNGSEPLKQRVSETPKRSNWRCDFADGSKFAATVEGSNNSKIVLSHTAIPSKESADEWKIYWKNLLEEFVKSVSPE